MDESAVETGVETKTTEGDQISVLGKQHDGRASEQYEPSFRGLSEYEEGEGKEDEKIVEEDGGEEVAEVKSDDVNETELEPEVLEELQRQKKKKKREERRLAREKLDRHYKTKEPEIEPELEQKKENEDDEEEDGEEREMAKEEPPETEDFPPQVEEFSRLKSSLALSETEDIRTAVSSSEDESDYARGPLGVSFKEDFLQLFFLPSISDITSESSEDQLASIRATIEQVEVTEEVDEGHFVNPLTGETDSSSSKDEEEEAKEEVEEEESSTTSEFEWPFDDDDIVPIVTKKIDAADMALEMFMDIQQSHIQVREEVTALTEQEKALREARQIASEFLTKMIDDAVETAEYVDPIKELRGKLDKPKMIVQLQKLYSQYLAAKFFNADVNVKLYEYYRRIGQLRCFDHLSPRVELIEYYRYMDAIHLLDHLRNRANETKKTNSAVLASVKMDLDYAHNIAIRSVDSLEACVRETLLQKDYFDYLPRIVESELRRMHVMRNEVSDNRLWLITRQHTLGSLVERKRNFDQITEDLTMDQFLLAQREVIALGTKLEERNHDLNRMRDRCTKHMHQLAFIREKISMNSATLVTKKIELEEQIKKQGHLREKLLKLKLQHASLKDEKNELHDKCGLLFKTALLHDYDTTEDYIQLKRKTVKKLRNTVAELEARIAVYEKNARDSDATSLRQMKVKKSKKGKH